MKTAVRLRMVLLPAALAMLLTFLAAIPAGVYALSGLPANLPSKPHLANPNTAMLTYKNDTFHSGANRNETTLTLSNVNALEFGKRVSFPVDGEVYAQPLFMPNVTIGGSTHNVVFVATENDSVYAYDADSTDASAAPLWQKNFGTPVLPSAVNCNDLNPQIGITSTPLIDPATNTLYVVTFTSENGQPVYRLHALDLTSGADKANIVISATVSGGGQGSSGGKIAFAAVHERQRANLLLDPANGQIYLSFASFCDITPYHGWVMGYSFSNNTFQQTAVYNDTPDGGYGGIWGGDGTMTADPSGNIYIMTGNGTFQTNTHDLGDSFVKLSPNLHVIDYFTPFNESCLEAEDADLGSGGPLVIPTKGELIGGGKEGRIYVLNMFKMGGFTAPPGGFSCSNQNATNVDHIIQELPPHTVGGIFNTPVTWSNGTTQYVYLAGGGQPIKAFVLNGNQKLNTAPSSQSPEAVSHYDGGNMVVSSNGNSNGILWTTDPTGVLRAYDATNLAHELYNSGMNPGRDALTGSFVKFSTPTVANGEVFVGTSNSLNVYSELASTGNNFNDAAVSDDTNPTAGNFDGAGRSYSAQALQSVGITPGASVNTNGFSFQWPNAQPGTPNNWVANGQVVPVTPVSGATVLGILGSSTFGSGSGTATMSFTDGTTQTFTLSFTDWWNGGSPLFGNGVAAVTPYLNNATGKQTHTVGLYVAQILIPAGKTLQSVTLPSNALNGQIHVFALATRTGSLIVNFNNVGISNDSSPTSGNIDGLGNSYSAQALQGAGITAGGSVNTGGFSFQWPGAQPGTADNWLANGEVVPVTSVSGANVLGILGISDRGSGSGTAILTFTDGTTQTFTLSFTDWWNGSTASFNNGVVAVVSYLNTTNGKRQHTVGLYTAQVLIPAGKTLQSVTLPSNATNGQLHVFALATRNSNTSGNFQRSSNGKSGLADFVPFGSMRDSFAEQERWMR